MLQRHGAIVKWSAHHCQGSATDLVFHSSSNSLFDDKILISSVSMLSSYVSAPVNNTGLGKQAQRPYTLVMFSTFSIHGPYGLDQKHVFWRSRGPDYEKMNKQIVLFMIVEIWDGTGLCKQGERHYTLVMFSTRLIHGPYGLD